MACCDCCCAKVNGECCGASGSKVCCKDLRICCNNVCCEENETCCGETCCPDTRVCCEEVCCAEGATCCGGECCPEGSYCCDGVCQEEPCEECETDSDCDYCDSGFSLVGGCSGISSELKCCADGATGWVDDANDARFPDCVSDCFDPGTVENNFNIVPGDIVREGYCCDGVCSEEECPP